MKTKPFGALFATLLLAAGALTGCGRQAAGDHEHAHAAAHGHDEELSAGASFKAGKGIMLTDETRKILGVEIADVAEEDLPRHVRFGLQVYGEKHHARQDASDHAGCEVLSSGFLPASEAALIRLRSPTRLLATTGETWAGEVRESRSTGAQGEQELVVGITGAGARLKGGEFLAASVTLPPAGKVAVVPAGALLRTVEGPFVYTVNGSAYFRTPVRTGAEADGKVEITDGLLAGDQVVIRPVEILWAIELRATKGGDACTH